MQAAATMDGRRSAARKVTPMRLAVLATIIEQPGWRYDIATRFDTHFGRVLNVTDRRIYQVVDDLLADGLVEVLRTPSAERRLHYGATTIGEQTHRHWLSHGIPDDGERVATRVGILAARSREQMLFFLDLHERRVLQALDRLRPARASATLVERLAVLHDRIALDHELDFIRHARAEIEDRA
jgi:DNA-binding PadR family transcriptional regulator